MRSLTYRSSQLNKGKGNEEANSKRSSQSDSATQRNESNPRKGLTGDEKVYLPALEIALPILEKRESEGATNE